MTMTMVVVHTSQEKSLTSTFPTVYQPPEHMRTMYSTSICVELKQWRSAGDFSCALRELRLLLLSPPASAGGELAYKDTFPSEEEGVGNSEDLPLLKRGGDPSVQLSITYLKFINYSFK